jgi:hypothetical protein
VKRFLLTVLLVTGGLSLAGWSLTSTNARMLVSTFGAADANLMVIDWAYSVVLFGLLLIVECVLIRLMDLKPVSRFWFSWLPFILMNPSFRILSGMTLPAPHDELTRKLQIATGLAMVLHLFLLALLLIRAMRRERVQRTVRVFTLLAVLLFSGLLLVTRNCGVTGDEPHYLLMAHSLLRDGDLDLANNYANDDASAFHDRGVLQPQGLEHVIEGRRYSHHPLGPVLLILPGYALGGRFGAALVMALLAAMTLGTALKVMKDSGTGGDTLLATGTVGLLASPLLLFSGLVFPEVPTALLLVLFLLARQARRDAAMGLAAGSLLWFHNRNVLLLIPLVLVYLWSNRSRIDRLLRFGTGLVLPLAFLALCFRSIYGVWTPLGAHNEPFTSLFRPDRFFIGFFGLLFDQEAGLWFHFPVFAAVSAGIFLLLRSRDPLRLYVAGTVLFYYLFMSFYENLGQAPAARFMVCLTPLLLLALAPVFEAARGREGWVRLLWVLGGVGVAVNAVLAAVPWMRYNRLEGENWMVRIAGDLLHLPWSGWEPSFHMDPVPLRSWVLSAFWALVTAILTCSFLRRTTNTGNSESQRHGGWRQDRHGRHRSPLTPPSPPRGRGGY